jgi:ribonuclease G
VGNIYKGKVTRLIPGIQAAFVDIGLERAAFLHVSDIYPIVENDADIRHFLRAGQEVLVQVYKDPLGSKGARITMQLAIPSRYLVFTPGVCELAISQKIVSDVDKERLLNMITPDAEGGYIFRTAALEAEQAELNLDSVFLRTLWSDICARAKTTKWGHVIYEDIPIALRILRDMASHRLERIRIDDETTATHMREFAKRYLPDLVDRIEYYTATQPIFDLYSVEEELAKALLRKVYLKSGGYLIFDQTEAMTTIDINTGSYVGQDNLEETIYKTNLEAVGVIARQLRLRNLGGIIIIDFIDMLNKTHQAQLLQLLTDELAKDTARIEISELSSLGLVQLTRKRTRESIERILCISCPLCKRRGLIKSLQTMAYEIFRDIKRMTAQYSWPCFLVVASNQVIHYIETEEADMLAMLENQIGRAIVLQSNATYLQEEFDVLPMADKE